MSKKGKKTQSQDPEVKEDDFRLYRKVRCPKCGARGWTALKKEVVNGSLRAIGCDLCPSHWEHH